jgi:hypothetical protein
MEVKKTLRQQLREVEIGGQVIIARDVMRPSSIRATCSALKMDEQRVFNVTVMPEGTKVQRIS